MKKRKLINWLCLSGQVSIVFYFLHDIIGARYYPDYNRLGQAVSDLTAADAGSFAVASGFLTVYKILNCLCCALLCIIVSDSDEKKTVKTGIYLFSVMSFISAAGYALFPLSGSGYDGSTVSFIHVYILTAIVAILSIVSLILLAIGFLRGKDKRKALGISAISALILMFVGTAGTAAVPREYFGLVERFSVYSAVVYTGILGLYGFGKTDCQAKESE